MNIPIPPRGQWRKKEAGVHPRRPPLPALDGAREVVVVARNYLHEASAEGARRVAPSTHPRRAGHPQYQTRHDNLVLDAVARAPRGLSVSELHRLLSLSREEVAESVTRLRDTGRATAEMCHAGVRWRAYGQHPPPKRRALEPGAVYAVLARNGNRGLTLPELLCQLAPESRGRVRWALERLEKVSLAVSVGRRHQRMWFVL